MKLFCIPHSGASAQGYFQWKKRIDPGITLCPLELPGRGKRFKEPFFESVQQAAVDLAGQIRELTAPGDTYALFGHSMGALLAFETYYHLEADRRPAHIFFCGRKAPQDREGPTAFYRLPDEAFLEIVYRFGGNTRQLLKHDRMRCIFLPILRADFRLVETYAWKPRKEKLACPFTVILGRRDESTAGADRNLWLEHGKGRVLTVEGDHFFLFEQPEELLNILHTTLLGEREDEKSGGNRQ